MLATIQCRIFVSPFVIHKDCDIENCNFAVVLYGCETWSLSLREECRLRASEKRQLRRTFGRKRDEVTGGGEENHKMMYDLYSSPNNVWVSKSRR